MKKSLICLLVLFVVFCSSVSFAEDSVARKAPELKADSWLNGSAVSLATLKDTLVVVEFWATWCPPCRESIPHLAEMNAKYKDKGVVFVSLSDEDEGTVAPFAKKAGMNWLVACGEDSSKAYGVDAIPTAFIVYNGEILWEGHPMSGLEEELAKYVKVMDDEKAPKGK